MLFFSVLDFELHIFKIHNLEPNLFKPSSKSEEINLFELNTSNTDTANKFFKIPLSVIKWFLLGWHFARHACPSYVLALSLSTIYYYRVKM